MWCVCECVVGVLSVLFVSVLVICVVVFMCVCDIFVCELWEGIVLCVFYFYVCVSSCECMGS